MKVRHILYIIGAGGGVVVLAIMAARGQLTVADFTNVFAAVASALGLGGGIEVGRRRSEDKAAGDPPKPKGSPKPSGGPKPSGHARLGALVVLGLLALVASATLAAGCAHTQCPDGESVVASVQPRAPGYVTGRCESDDRGDWRQRLEGDGPAVLPVVCPPGHVPGPREGTREPVDCGAGQCTQAELTCVPAGGDGPPDPKGTAQPPTKDGQAAAPPAEGATRRDEGGDR